ncbi:MAG TPA: hypothetical protein VM285_12145, partial [Polyangia bacterium]|nr:hypothetical protein [Polyangia bacterium]
LSMAQTAETDGRLEAATVIYGRLVDGYRETPAGATAAERLPVVRKLAMAPVRPEPELVPPRIDLQAMLDRGPAVYVAAFLAAHYRDDPSLTARLHEAIGRYLAIAFRDEGIEPARLAREPEFQDGFFQAEFFSVKPKCKMVSDWIYDDFAVENANFFPWTSANVRLTVRQGDQAQSAEQRLERLEPGQALDLLEFRVKKTGGVVRCEMEITATEGKSARAEEL